ncbi:hypothetical protein DYI95_004505 [Thermaerobacter sp. PB12/4term]|uniref:hypothetical protein n=1 Tax=Thermaerobacter sp. PB12/4term TaxID=2293838 RepID=UPI0011C02B80|nr:hypothetical protein [Thermaerobacter sp. PB12/4term]QIA26876.1 hypothetical protein DYI95_004505 [Thermaerobacter sp. PB12/4term]
MPRPTRGTRCPGGTGHQAAIREAAAPTPRPALAPPAAVGLAGALPAPALAATPLLLAGATAALAGHTAQGSQALHSPLVDALPAAP